MENILNQNKDDSGSISTNPLEFNYGNYTKSIYDFSRNLDYTLDTAKERIEYLNGLLYKDGELDEYFVDLFAQSPTGNLVNSPSKPPFNVCLTKSDPSCSSTYVSKELERMADYILRANDIDKDEYVSKPEHDILLSYRKHNVSLDSIMESDSYQEIEAELSERAKKSNYRKECKQKITLKDLKDPKFNVDVIYSYERDDGSLLSVVKEENILKQYDDLKKAEFTCSGGKKRGIVSGILKDQIDIKNSFRGCVKYKHVDKDTTVIDWDCVDYGDKKQLKYLLQLKGDLTTDVGIIQYDMDQIISGIDFSDVELEMLQEYRDDAFNVAKWSERLGMTEGGVYRRRDAIIQKIANQYYDLYEDWYYLNCKKGKYKKCSKCGNVLLISKFGLDAHKPDGYYSSCKKCRSLSQYPKNDI